MPVRPAPGRDQLQVVRLQVIMIIRRLSRKISFDRRDLITAFPALPHFVIDKIGDA